MRENVERERDMPCMCLTAWCIEISDSDHKKFSAARRGFRSRFRPTGPTRSVGHPPPSDEPNTCILRAAQDKRRLATRPEHRATRRRTAHGPRLSPRVHRRLATLATLHATVSAGRPGAVLSRAARHRRRRSGGGCKWNGGGCGFISCDSGWAWHGAPRRRRDLPAGDEGQRMLLAAGAAHGGRCAGHRVG